MSSTTTMAPPASRTDLMSAAAGEDISQRLWSQFTAAIAASLGEGATQASIQVLPQAVRLPEAGLAKGAFNNALDLFFDTIPQWGSAYTPSNQNVLYAYQTVLQQINPAPTSSADLQQRYQAQIDAAGKAADAASAYYLAKASGYTAERQQLNDAGLPPQAIPTWEQYWSPFQRVFDTMIANSTKLSAEALDLVRAQASGDVVQALAQVNDWIKANTANPIPPWNFVTDPWTLLNNWVHGQSLAPFRTTFDASSQTYDYAKSTWEETSSSSVFFGLWRRSSTTRGATESSLSANSRYSMLVTYDATALLTAMPSPTWYNGTVLMNYKIGPWVKGSNFDTNLAHPWGNGGVFPIQVTSAWVVLNPTITIQLDQQSYNSLKSSFQQDGGGGFSFGPFYRNPDSRSTSDTKQNTSFQDTSSSVVITDASNVPQIVAVSNQVMPG